MFCTLCNFTYPECLYVYESHLQCCAFVDSVYILAEMGNGVCFIMKTETALEWSLICSQISINGACRKLRVFTRASPFIIVRTLLRRGWTAVFSIYPFYHEQRSDYNFFLIFKASLNIQGSFLDRFSDSFAFQDSSSADLLSTSYIFLLCFSVSYQLCTNTVLYWSNK